MRQLVARRLVGDRGRGIRAPHMTPARTGQVCGASIWGRPCSQASGLL